MPGYAVTPLVELPSLAVELSVGRLLIKDESSRMGLPAFKVLGASWASHQALQRNPGAELVTATDGNHGRAVARMARHFGVAATVYPVWTQVDELGIRDSQAGELLAAADPFLH